MQVVKIKVGNALREVKVSVGEGKHRVDLTTIITMEGLIAIIVGGNKSHVGAVAIGIPRPSLKDSSKFSATTSVFTLVGHKDDELARPAAEKLAKELNQVVVVVAGVHIKNASNKDIKKLTYNSMQTIQEFLREVKK